MKKDIVKSGYPFEWLENLVLVKLNPNVANLKETSEKELTTWENQLSFETWQLINDLKVRTFGKSEKKIRNLIAHFKETIIVLIAQAKTNIADCEVQSTVYLTEQVILGLEQIKMEVENRYEKYLSKSPATSNPDREESAFKVLCRLSVDQLALLIKAADDTKLILSRSISLIFRSLVPFLSTEKIKNISWMSMRKSSYQFAKADIDYVVSILERMIIKIKAYY